MKKTLLATAIPALLLANATTATELYADKTNTFSVGGHLSASLAGSDKGSTGVDYISPRINFSATRDLGNGFTADAKVEWSVNMATGGEQALSTRLGYLGLTHDIYGRVVLGTQWAPTVDVAGVTDIPIVFSNDFLYEDQGNLGTARADAMISYRTAFSFTNGMELNLGFGAQGKHGDANAADRTDEYDARYQAAATLVFAEYSLGVAYNKGDVTYVGSQEETAVIANISAKYGSYGQDLYAAVVYGEEEFTKDFDGNVIDERTDFEALISYGFTNNTVVSINYEDSKNKTDNSEILSQVALSVEYNFTSSVVGYAGYQIDRTDAENNQWNIGGRIYL